MRSGPKTYKNTNKQQGLAHYLEHMLFMGSAKYPDENEYDSFISQMGGSSNAFTECEYTLYHFDVLPDHLEKVRWWCARSGSGLTKLAKLFRNSHHFTYKIVPKLQAGMQVGI